MRVSIRRLSIWGLLLAFGLLLVGSVQAQTTEVDVTATNSHGWTFWNDGNPIMGFASNASAAAGAGVLGQGYLQVGINPGAPPADKVIIQTPFVNRLASEFQSLSWDYFAAATSAPAVVSGHFYINIYIDLAPHGAFTFGAPPWYDCRYAYTPANGNVKDVWLNGVLNTATVLLNTTPAPVPAGCASTLGGLPAGANILMIRLNAGQSLDTDNGLLGGYDNIRLVTTTSDITYDFEVPVALPAAAVAPEDWSNVGGEGSNCYDHILRRIQTESGDLSLRCADRITDPAKRPATPEGYTYVAPTYVIDGFVIGQDRIPRTAGKIAKACFNTTSLAEYHPLSVAYHYGQFDPISIIATIPAPHDYFCVDFLGNGYLSLLSGQGVPSAVVPAVPSTTTATETPLASCQVTTRSILNLRDAPSLAGNVLTLVPFGEAGTTLSASAKSADGQWVKVNFGGLIGWLNVGFLELRGSC